jgi:hypothetical protein
MRRNTNAISCCSGLRQKAAQIPQLYHYLTTSSFFERIFTTDFPEGQSRNQKDFEQKETKETKRKRHSGKSCRKGAKAQRRKEFFASLRLCDFALKHLFYP